MSSVEVEALMRRVRQSISDNLDGVFAEDERPLWSPKKLSDAAAGLVERFDTKIPVEHLVELGFEFPEGTPTGAYAKASDIRDAFLKPDVWESSDRKTVTARMQIPTYTDQIVIEFTLAPEQEV